LPGESDAAEGDRPRMGAPDRRLDAPWLMSSGSSSSEASRRADRSSHLGRSRSTAVARLRRRRQPSVRPNRWGPSGCPDRVDGSLSRQSEDVSR
jgi:hypothetical protein